MSQDPRPSRANPKLEELLDHLLGPVDEAAALKEVETDPLLRQEATLQRWIDDELSEVYEYDASRGPVFPAAEEAREPIPFPATRRMWKGLAVAAAILLVGIGVRLAVFSGGGSGPVVGPEQVYARLVSRGFTPDFVCTSDEEFKAATQKRLGTPLLMASTGNIELLGWAYNAGFRGKIIGDHTMLLLTRVDSREVLVLMDWAASDRPLSLPPDSKLHLYRQQVGPIINYEISPLDSPRVINKLVVAK